MFKNNKGQNKRLCILLVLSLLFKTSPILSFEPLTFAGGAVGMYMINAAFPGKAELITRKSYNSARWLVSKCTGPTQDEKYFKQKRIELEREIEEDKQAFTLLQAELEEHKRKVDKCDFGSRDHLSIQQIEIDNKLANTLSILAKNAYICAVEMAEKEKELREIKEK